MNVAKHVAQLPFDRRCAGENGVAVAAAEFLSGLRTSSAPHLIDCLPGGNRTVLVVGSGTKASRRGAFARALQVQAPSVEQVGFLESPHNSACIARLEMAGGEFCINAARSAAAFLATGLPLTQLEGGARCKGEKIGFDESGCMFSLEVSGADSPLVARVQPKFGFDVSISLNICKQRLEVRNVISLLGACPSFGTVVEMPGIAYLVLGLRELLHVVEEGSIAECFKKIEAQHALGRFPAIGMIGCEVSGDRLRIEPIVFVRAVGSYYRETACGSGSLAAVLAYHSSLPGTDMHLKVFQPSGAHLDVAIRYPQARQSPVHVQIGGMVQVGIFEMLADSAGKHRSKEIGE